MSGDPWPSTHLSMVLKVTDPSNADAWSDFVECYRTPIVRLCRGRFGMQESEAEDVAQGVLLKLVVAMQQFQYDSSKSFRGWLKTVTKHAVIDHLSKARRRVDLGSGDTRVNEMIQNSPNPADAIADALSEQMRLELVQRAEQTVEARMKNPKNWQAYCARKQGRPARQTAQDLGMTVAAVHKAKSRVLDMIRDEISKLLSTQ